MSEIKALDKLRSILIQLPAPTHSDELLLADMDACIKAIEAEIAANYMRLPVDADGVPIHVGDEVCGYGYPNGGVVVKSLNGHMIIVGRLEGGENYAKSGLLWSAKDTRHVKPRTLTDILADLFERKMSVTDAEHEISELLGGDAE